MSVSGGYVPFPEEIEILKELETISEKGIVNSQFLQVIKYMRSCYAHVRAKCLRVIGGSMEPSSQVPCGRSTVFELVQWHSADCDARVRETALWVHVQWLKRGIVMADIPVLCDMVESGVADCEDEVVMTALRLAVELGRARPALMVGRSKSQMRLVDKGFTVVAGAMNHASASVRKVAAQLLSAVPGVSEPLLLATLEKTVMTDRVIRKSAFDKTNEINRLFWIDELSNFASRSAENVTADEALSMGGISGTVVSGLEDDLYEIRLDTVNSVGTLCLLSPKFATACQDLLVDMLTDDIEVVRAAAVTNLSLATGIRNNMTLRSDQLDIVLSVLDEKSGNMRRSIHLLLAKCRLASANALMQLLDALKRNLAHYELDRDSIWRCSAQVGHNHPQLVQIKLHTLLNLHPYLMVKQCLRSDPEYITVLLMVINAGRRLASIKAHFPTHVKEHEIYITELVPDMIYDGRDEDRAGMDVCDEPLSKQAKYDDISEMVTDTAVSRHDLYSCLVKTISVLQRMLSGDGGVHCYNNTVMRQLLRDLRQISRLCFETKSLCLWLRDLGQMARLSQHRPLTLATLSEARYLCYKMIYAYAGITRQDDALLRQFIDTVDKKIECIQSQDFLPTRETKEILSTCPPLVSLTTLSIITNVTGTVTDNTHSLLSSSVVQVTAKQLYPTAHETEKSALKFCAGMCLNLPVRAEFTGLDVVTDHKGDIAVKTPIVVVINRPDAMVLRWQPPDHCWTVTDRRGTATTVILDTEVALSFNEWSEPGMVHLGLAVLLPDIGAVWKLTEPIGIKVYPMAANRAF